MASSAAAFVMVPRRYRSTVSSACWVLVLEDASSPEERVCDDWAAWSVMSEEMRVIGDGCDSTKG